MNPIGIEALLSGELWATVSFLAVLAIQAVLVVVVLLRPRTTQAVRLAWLLVVLVLPIAGGLLYLRIGLPQQRRSARDPCPWGAPARVDPEAFTEHAVLGQDPALQKGSRLVEAIGGFPVTHGNAWHVYADFAAAEDDIASAFHELVRDIDGARHSCHLLFYIALDDATGAMVGEALVRAAKRGVACRLLVDDVGSRAFLRSRLCRALRDDGVQVATAMPVRWYQVLLTRFDLRNHRKITVIDGRIGWTGSQNLADTAFAVKARYAPWVDLMVRFEGPVVGDLQRVFVSDWMHAVHDDPARLLSPSPDPRDKGVPVQVLPSGPGAHTRALRELSLLAFIEADEELIMTTPYFVPDEATFSALLAAARSGVRTVLVLPRRNDSHLVAAASRAHYDELLEAGVEIHEFQGGLLHSKTICADGIVSLVATANLDRRSFELNFEINILVADRAFTAEIRRVQDEYIRQSVRVQHDHWSHRSAWRRGWENLASLVAPLL